jgi:hypothetical protein
VARPIVPAALLGTVAFLCAAAPASAHVRSGVVAVDYRATVAQPRGGAFRVRVVPTDRALQLTVRPGHSVVVLGYLGEPFIRLDRAGLAIDAGSPTSAAAGLLGKRTPRTGWLVRRGRRSVVWHDARLRALAPGVTSAAWRVPLVVDGRRAELRGELRRFRRPPLWPWLALVAVFGAASAASMRVHDRERLRRASTVLALAGTVVAVLLGVVFALDRYASPGTWIASADELVFAAVGVGVLLGGPQQARVGAAIGLGLLVLAIGLSYGQALLHPLVLSLLPGTPVRLAVATAIGVGAAASIVGARVACLQPRAAPEDAWSAGLPPAGARPT